jgi:hypothetical protein
MRITRDLRIRLFAAALLLAGCNYFRPAQPEIPSNVAPSVPTDYSTPDATLQTLKLAIEDKSTTTGQTAYMGAFANPAADGQGFTATFDPLTVARFNPTPDTNWSFDREQLFYSNLSRVDGDFKFLFSWGDFLGDRDVIEPTTATLYKSYILEATQNEGASYVHEARGNAEIHMVLIGNKWKIVQWIDSEDPHADINAGQRSFGFLRLAGP